MNLITSPTIQLTKTELAQLLGYSRSSLYYQPTRPIQDLIFKTKIELVLSNHPSYGHRRLALKLKVNKKRVRRIMRLFGIKPYRRRTQKLIKKGDLNKPPANYGNLIKYLCPIRPNVVWVTDFTYFYFQSRFMYLATVMDMFTREIIGFTISRNHDQVLVLNALNMAINDQNCWPFYHHSDQGSEYESTNYIRRLKEGNTKISMSQKSSPWENGFQESFYSGFKLDLGNFDQFETKGELIAAIYSTIYTYNTNRIHTSLKTTPNQFKEQYFKKQKNDSTTPFVDN